MSWLREGLKWSLYIVEDDTWLSPLPPPSVCMYVCVRECVGELALSIMWVPEWNSDRLPGGVGLTVDAT